MRKQTLRTVMKTALSAEYEFDGYYVYVSEGDTSGYDLSVCKEAMPPHVCEHHETIEGVEDSLDGTLGYEKGKAVWVAGEEE